MTRKQLVSHGLLLTLAIGVIGLRCSLGIGDSEAAFDSPHYLRLAYNLHHHGTLSMSGSEPIAPTAYREPGYPLFIHLAMGLDRTLGNLSKDAFFAGKWGPYRQFLTVKWLQALVLVAIGLVAFWLCWTFTGHPAVGYLALLLIGCSPACTFLVNEIMADTLSALFLVGVCASLPWLWRRGSGSAHGWAGLLLAGLTLIRAAYSYLWPVVLAVSLLRAWQLPQERRRRLIGSAVFLCCYFALVGGWMMRNHHHFGRAYLTERGGAVLNIRAEYNQMSGGEYLAAFVYWLPMGGPLRERCVARVNPGLLTRLNRKNQAGYYRRGVHRWRELGRNRTRSGSDRALLDEARNRILAHPGRHLAVTLPIAWRSVFVETRYVLPNLFLFGSLFGFLGLALWRRRIEWLLLVLPVLYHFAFHALLSHGLPRYNWMLVPMLWVTALLLGYHGWGPPLLNALRRAGRRLAARNG